MTKYILHGGYLARESIHNTRFYQECLDGLAGTIRVVILLHAGPEEKWEERFQWHKNKLHKYIHEGQHPQCTLGSGNVKELEKQVTQSDLVYAPGGPLQRFSEIFRELPNMKKLLDRKVYAGSSAGVNGLSRYHVSYPSNEIKEGAGILPLKAFVHWDPSKQEQYEQLKRYGDDLEVLTLPETKFVAREQ